MQHLFSYLSNVLKCYQWSCHKPLWRTAFQDNALVYWIHLAGLIRLLLWCVADHWCYLSSAPCELAAKNICAVKLMLWTCLHDQYISCGVLLCFSLVCVQVVYATVGINISKYFAIVLLQWSFAGIATCDHLQQTLEQSSDVWLSRQNSTIWSVKCHTNFHKNMQRF